MATDRIPENLIGPAAVAKKLQLSEATVRSDVSRRPHRLPPRFLKPGSNRLLWREDVVDAWIAAQLM